MQILRTCNATVLAACLLVACTTVCAQTNPLYEHRRSLGAASAPQSVLLVSVTSVTRDGRVVLDALSARLIGDGIKSGDPVEIDLGTQSIRANVGFSDEIDRAKSYYAHGQRQAPVELGVTLIVDRVRPAEPIVLDSSVGGAMMPLGVDKGQRFVIRYFRAGGR